MAKSRSCAARALKKVHNMHIFFYMCLNDLCLTAVSCSCKEVRRCVNSQRESKCIYSTCPTTPASLSRLPGSVSRPWASPPCRTAHGAAGNTSAADSGSPTAPCWLKHNNSNNNNNNVNNNKSTPPAHSETTRPLCCTWWACVHVSSRALL